MAIVEFGFINSTWGGGATGSPVPEPHLLSLDLGPRAPFRGLDGSLPSPVFGWMVLAVTVGLCLLVASIRRGDLGRRMLAVRSNERAAAAAAVNVRNVKLIAFGISAFIAGVAGSLYAYNFGSVSAARFNAVTALALIAFAYAGGITLVSGAVFAGLISTQALVPHMLDKWLGLEGTWFLLFGGVLLIFTLLQHPEGVAGAFYKRLHRRRTRSDEGPGAPLRAGTGGQAMTAILEARDVGVRFGGVQAVAGVDLTVEEGLLVGLIGPNGAGKTTFVDALTGFVRYSGSFALDGRDLAGLPPHERARLGLARTWQSTELFDDLSVSENLAVAASDPEGPQEGLDLLDLGWAADLMPNDLSQGERKLVGLARAVAMRPRLLCLDEPAAGLDTSESEELGRRLRKLGERAHLAAADRPRHGPGAQHLRPHLRARVRRADRRRPARGGAPGPARGRGLPGQRRGRAQRGGEQA